MKVIQVILITKLLGHALNHCNHLGQVRMAAYQHLSLNEQDIHWQPQAFLKLESSSRCQEVACNW